MMPAGSVVGTVERTDGQETVLNAFEHLSPSLQSPLVGSKNEGSGHPGLVLERVVSGATLFGHWTFPGVSYHSGS